MPFPEWVVGPFADASIVQPLPLKPSPPRHRPSNQRSPAGGAHPRHRPTPIQPLLTPPSSLQEFRRQASVAGSARDRADLLGAAGTSGSASASGLGAPGSSMGLLLRERGMVASSHAALDDVMGTAHGVAAGLGQQREVFEGVSGKLGSVGAAFPVVNTLLNAIRRKKNKVGCFSLQEGGGVVVMCRDAWRLGMEGGGRLRSWPLPSSVEPMTSLTI